MIDPDSLVHVAVAVIENPRGHILLSLRHDHVHQGGLWEFPGGKLEEDETPREALEREIREELGIECQKVRPMIRIHHDYGDMEVLLDVWKVTRYSGLPQGREGQELEWVAPERLFDYPMPEADVPIVHAIRLPERYMITPDPGEDHKVFLEHLSEIIGTKNIRLLQLRAHRLNEQEYAELAEQVLKICRSQGTQLVLNALPEMLDRVDADGIHLTSSRLEKYEERPVAREKWLSAACHNAEQLEKAHQIDVDFSVISPVLPTSTHADAVTLGWMDFWQLSEQARIPVYALGGMSEEHLHQAFVHGGQGIAAIRSLWD